MLTPLRRQWPAVLFENRYSTQQDINMIISHKHRFIFLKTRKTAGTSVERALSAVCGADDVLTPGLGQDEGFRLGKLGPRNYEYVPPLYSTEWPNLVLRFIRDRKMPLDYYNHMHAWRVRRRVSRTIWNSYYKFAFDRNPWDREISWYYQLKAHGRRTGSFQEHLRQLPGARMGNHDIYSIAGKVVVDFLGRYESLEDDLRKVMSDLGVSSLPPLPVTNNRNRKDQQPYQEMYDDTNRELIANTYRREIDLLDYTF